MNAAQSYAAANHERLYAQLKDLIRIPSISTQKAHDADVQAAAEWLAEDMRRMGWQVVEIIRMPEGRHPLVWGEWLGAGPAAPTVLIYSHYDVQPAEMEDGWETPPFDPVERDGRLYARGATDSKVNVMTQLKAVESLLATEGQSPVNLKIVLEGEEESGSENINAFAARHLDRLRADICVISDGGIVAPDQPSLVLGLRGIVTLEVTVQGPARDLHSGHYGGNVHNPIQALCEILAQLHDANGTVTVPGFYDSVLKPDSTERALLADIDPWYDADWQRTAAAPQPWGEAGYSIHERAGIRPTLEINGMWGGYTAAGVKTVLPSLAHAKISCRLVPHQSPDRIYGLVCDHLSRLAPPTVRLEVTRQDMGAPAVRFPHDTRAVEAAAAAYREGWGKPSIFEVAGGSVPIANTLQDAAGQMVIMGYGYKGGQNHGPNEHIIVENFGRGIRTAIAFLQTVGECR